jgi:hypothetical protein
LPDWLPKEYDIFTCSWSITRIQSVVKYKIVIKENKRVKQLHLAQDVITVFSQQRLTTSRISFTENNYWIAKVVFRYSLSKKCRKRFHKEFRDPVPSVAV